MRRAGGRNEEAVTRAERKAWLAGLKEGDEVAVTADDRPESLRYAWITTLTMVNERGFGWPRGSGMSPGLVKPNGRIRTPYGSAYIQPVTDEIRQAVRDRSELAAIGRTDWARVPVEVRRQIAALLRIVTP